MCPLNLLQPFVDFEEDGANSQEGLLHVLQWSTGLSSLLTRTSNPAIAQSCCHLIPGTALSIGVTPERGRQAGAG